MDQESWQCHYRHVKETYYRRNSCRKQLTLQYQADSLAINGEAVYTSHNVHAPS